MAKTAVVLVNNDPKPAEPILEGELFAETIELHQPSELIGNAKTLSAKNAILKRLADGTGDWHITSKKSNQSYILGAGNMKMARLKAST
jgi:hypothetical protein